MRASSYEEALARFVNVLLGNGIFSLVAFELAGFGNFSGEDKSIAEDSSMLPRMQYERIDCRYGMNLSQFPSY
ncbi:uncharacterized protein BO72DRAFT_279990 [Aspergillus fijiensis CBS 313.89]|uniref:Uncharacterized protein n=1 Tax=Aspergillus fijiensis CBS 313.89 TaxID=1448319 RepID=A0A8G1REG1_9EURO|nr:uncharacterized protein BO72DRAFT_279990 [Aspergillus fijiensis CBS 313.89]RAK72322.1 hypothetical protein BO72DRAFT_279990 [Aspergillus fijiensis CBS 313.89]